MLMGNFGYSMCSYEYSKKNGKDRKKETFMKKSKLLIVGTIVLLMAFGLVIGGCFSMAETQLSPNSSQSVTIVKRASSDVEKNKVMDVYIDGRKEGKPILNGSQGQMMTMNGLHNIQVKVGNFQSQLLTYDGRSEVVEFYVNFEGKGKARQLNLLKVSGGNGGTNTANTPAAGASSAPVINITVDNSSSNTASSDNSSNLSNNVIE